MSSCHAIDGTQIAHGGNYVPGPDMCTMCKCIEGKPSLCHSVLCQSPQDCKVFTLGDTCCDYICLDDKSQGGASDFGLRMVGSAITAIMSLGLLLFLVHRLRQRKLRAAQNQYIGEHMDAMTGIPPDSCHSNPCCHSTAYFSGNDHVDMFLNGQTPPYSPWKTSLYFQHKEPPPSYNEAVAQDQSSSEANAPDEASAAPVSYGPYSDRYTAQTISAIVLNRNEMAMSDDATSHLSRNPYPNTTPSLLSDQLYERSEGINTISVNQVAVDEAWNRSVLEDCQSETSEHS